VITRHPYRAVSAVLSVLAVSLFVGNMIGQFNDGPWGGLPTWLGTAAHSLSLASIVVVLLLTAYLGVANLRYRQLAR
jgi:hypothetical protein